MFGLKVRDVNFSFKLVKREVLKKAKLHSQGSFIDAELLIEARKHGFFASKKWGCVIIPAPKGFLRWHHRRLYLRLWERCGPIIAAIFVMQPGMDEVKRLIVNADDLGLHVIRH